MPGTTVVNGVVVEKPWYASKKIWLTVITLGVALYQGITGKHTDLTATEVTDKIVTTATWLGPLLTAVMAIAHVDANVRTAVINADAVAKSLNSPDALDAAVANLKPAANDPVRDPVSGRSS